MLFKIDNRILVQDREKTYLTGAGTAGDTSITVRAVDIDSGSNLAFSDNDYLIIGQIGSENAEIVQINDASLAAGTTITIDGGGGAGGGLAYNHSINEPVYRIDYNQLELYNNSTDTTSGASLLATVSIQPDSIFTIYEDISNTTGFGFVRFKNSTSSTFSSYSDGIPYAGQSAKSLAKMRSKVRSLLDETNIAVDDNVTDVEIDEALNDKQREIAHDDIFSFYEIERSDSSVANQFAYDISGDIKGGTVHTVLFDTQPLVPIKGRSKWDALHFDTDASTTDPSHFHVWNNQVKLYARPSAAATTTTLNGAVSDATATTITVTSTTSFNRGDYYRFKINDEIIYATASTATTFTGCLRGQEGTTAATHSDSDTVTELNIVMTGQEEPDDLVDLNDETKIPEPLVLCHGAAADLAYGRLKDTPLGDRMQAKYDAGMKGLREKYLMKTTGSFHVVKPNSTYRQSDIRHPNDFPSSVG